jgi:hypothetical protein
VSSRDDRRSGFQQYKEDVKRRGKPFYPFAMFHDTVMSLVVVTVIGALAFVWRYTDIIGPLIGEKADPGTTSFVPRPDWYFYFLFYLLRIFKWPESVILATVGIPTICLILLLVLPFIDMRMERRLTRRPVAVVAAILTVISMAVLTYKGGDPRLGAGSGLRRQPGGARRCRPLRRVRLRRLPHLPRHGQHQPWRARPERGGREEQGHPVPDRPPQVPELRQSRLGDATVRRARRREPPRARGLPRGLQGPEVGA